MRKIILKEPFLSVYKKIEDIQKYDRYIAAYIFGSVARGEQNINSDFDVMVVISEDNNCSEINHPIINGIKLDITFGSLAKIKEINDEVVKKGERMPMLAESIIVFDKTGELKQLKKTYSTTRPKAKANDHQHIHFMLYHSDNKAKRNLENDKATALLALSININEVLKYHYHINGRWWLSNKRILADLRIWDPEMAELLEKFVSTSDLDNKYALWSGILDHVAKTIGGRKVISDINCNCENCKKDLANLTR